MTATVVDSRARLIVAGPDLAEHVRRHGPVPWQGGPHRLIPLVEAAGLTGHGGAGFPTHRKLAAVAAGDRPVVVGNGAEGEPASAKDRTLLHHAPHLVLDGLQLAAECVGASQAYLYVQQAPAEAVRHALAQRRAAQQDRIAVEVVVAADRFVSGEESAVVSAVEGRAPLPRDKFRMVVKSGVRGRPTLVQNVETLGRPGSAAGVPPRSRARSWPPSTVPSVRRACTSCPTAYPSRRRSPGPAGHRYRCRLFSSVASTAPGFPRRPSARRCPVPACAHGERYPVPVSSSPCRSAGAV